MQPPIEIVPPRATVSRKTVTLLIVLIVIGSGIAVGSAWLWIMGGSETRDYSPLSTLTITNEADGYRFTFGRVNYVAQITWMDIKIQFWAAGMPYATWNINHAIFDSGDVTLELGPRPFWDNVAFCNVTDVEHNGLVNQDDFFVITMGTIEAFEQVVTYEVHVIYSPQGISMCGIDFHGVGTRPNIVLSDGISARFGYRYTVEESDSIVGWQNITLNLKKEPSTTPSLTWSTSSADLMQGPGSKMIFPGLRLDNATFFCNVTDVKGDGYISVGDYVELTIGSDNTLPGHIYYLQVVYKPSHRVCAARSFEGFALNVTAAITKSNIPYGVICAIANASSELRWDEVIIRLTDGTHSVEWRVAQEFYVNATPRGWRFPGAALGPLTVFCNITLDTQSPYWLVGNHSFMLTTGSVLCFSTGTSYTVSFVYAHTMEAMCQLIFTG